MLRRLNAGVGDAVPKGYSRDFYPSMRVIFTGLVTLLKLSFVSARFSRYVSKVSDLRLWVLLGPMW